MKSKIKESPDTPPYPKLMKYPDSGLIVLITEVNGQSGKGVVVHQGSSHYKVGRWSDTWSPASFKEYNGTVTLEN